MKYDYIWLGNPMLSIKAFLLKQNNDKNKDKNYSNKLYNVTKQRPG